MTSRWDRSRPGHWIGIAALALALRLIPLAAPGLMDPLPRPYLRILNVAEAAENVRAGRGAVVDLARVHEAVRVWSESGTWLPAAQLPSLPPDVKTDPRPYFDERGYLMLMLLSAELTGEVGWKAPRLLQALLSAALAALLVVSIGRGFGSPRLGLLAGAVYALHPLEIFLASAPDLPAWGVYATAGSVALLVHPWQPLRGGRILLALALGLLLGACVVQRAPSLAPVAGALVLLPWVQGGAGWRAAALAGLGGGLALTLAALMPLEGASVGRSAKYHTLLGGLAEFGDIEGLAWLDSSIHDYLKRRHGVDPLTPEFDRAARIELEGVLADRPWLPLQVAARRLGEIVVAWRPARRGGLELAAITVFKGLVAIGVWRATRRARAAGKCWLLLTVLAVTLAPVLAHSLIVPLLEVYIAGSFVLLSPLAAWGGLWLLASMLPGPCAERLEGRSASSTAGGRP